MVLLVDTTIAVEVLLQMVLFGDVMTGVGSTVTTTLIGVPEHNKVPGAVPVQGVMLYVTVWAVVPEFARVCAIVLERSVPFAPPLPAPVMFDPTPLTVQV